MLRQDLDQMVEAFLEDFLPRRPAADVALAALLDLRTVCFGSKLQPQEVTKPPLEFH